MWRFAVGALGIVALVGCGRVGFDGVSDPTGDGGGGGDGGSGSGDGGGVVGCSAWDAPILQTNLAGASNDWEPAMSPNGLEMVFASDRSGRNKLYYTSRSSLAQQFGAPTLIASLDTGDAVYAPSWQADGRLLYVHANNTTHFTMSATIAGGGVFTNPMQLTNLPYLEQLVLSDDGTEMFGTRYVALGGNAVDIDLFYASNTTGSWVEDPSMFPPEMNRIGADLYDGWPSFDEAHQQLLWERAMPNGAGETMSIRRMGPHQPFIASTLESVALPVFTGDPDFAVSGTLLAFAGETMLGLDTDIYVTSRVCN